jgi:hypothetical protein
MTLGKGSTVFIVILQRNQCAVYVGAILMGS